VKRVLWTSKEDRMVEDSVHFCKVLSTNRAGVWTYDHASGALSCSSEVFGMLGDPKGISPTSQRHGLSSSTRKTAVVSWIGC